MLRYEAHGIENNPNRTTLRESGSGDINELEAILYSYANNAWFQRGYIFDGIQCHLALARINNVVLTQIRTRDNTGRAILGASGGAGLQGIVKMKRWAASKLTLGNNVVIVLTSDRDAIYAAWEQGPNNQMILMARGRGVYLQA